MRDSKLFVVGWCLLYVFITISCTAGVIKAIKERDVVFAVLEAALGLSAVLVIALTIASYKYPRKPHGKVKDKSTK